MRDYGISPVRFTAFMILSMQMVTAYTSVEKARTSIATDQTVRIDSPPSGAKVTKRTDLADDQRTICRDGARTLILLINDRVRYAFKFR